MDAPTIDTIGPNQNAVRPRTISKQLRNRIRNLKRSFQSQELERSETRGILENLTNLENKWFHISEIQQRDQLLQSQEQQLKDCFEQIEVLLSKENQLNSLVEERTKLQENLEQLQESMVERDLLFEEKENELAESHRKVEYLLTKEEEFARKISESELREREALAQLKKSKAAYDAKAKGESAEIDELRQQLSRSHEELDQLKKSILDSTQSLDERMQELKELKATVDRLQGCEWELTELQKDHESQSKELEFVASELEELQRVQNEGSHGTDEQVEVLRKQLLDSRHETVELRMQNADLADQLAKHQVNHGNHSTSLESMTWEERKRRLMLQLEAETEDTPVEHKRRLEIEEVIATSHNEIERRNQEICELRQLLAQQASAHDGLAVGAAAIAQFLDSDELVQLEREKLREIQAEWEAKVRKAEIDLSLERAKLARQRLELEERITQSHNPAEPETDTQGTSKRGKWLARLGIREGKE